MFTCGGTKKNKTTGNSHTYKDASSSGSQTRRGLQCPYLYRNRVLIGFKVKLQLELKLELKSRMPPTAPPTSVA